MSLLFNDLNSAASLVASDLGFTSASTNSNKETTATQTAKSTTSSQSSKTSSEATSTAATSLTSPSQTTKSVSSTTSNSLSKITSPSSSSVSITSTKFGSSTTSSTPTSISSSSSSSGSSFATIKTSAPANPIALPTSTSVPASSSNGNTVSTAGIVVAVFFTALIMSGIAYLLWKYLPAARRYRERKYEERSYREGMVDKEDDMFSDPKQGLALRKFSFHTAPTYYPGQPHEPQDMSHRPLNSALDEYIVSPISVRSIGSISQHTLPSALQPGITTHVPYRDVRASQIGVAVPIRSPRPSEKGLPPLPSTKYGRPFM